MKTPPDKGESNNPTAVPAPTQAGRKPTCGSRNGLGGTENEGPGISPPRTPPRRFVVCDYSTVTGMWSAACPVCHLRVQVFPGDPQRHCGEEFNPVDVVIQ
jgi:hypothetical protein